MSAQILLDGTNVSVCHSTQTLARDPMQTNDQKPVDATSEHGQSRKRGRTRNGCTWALARTDCGLALEGTIEPIETALGHCGPHAASM